MIPLCRICNHEHGVADPHVFGGIEVIQTPDKGAVYVPTKECATEVSDLPRRKQKRGKKATARLAADTNAAGHASKPASDAGEDAHAILASIRSRRAKYMKVYRARDKAKRAAANVTED